MTLVYQAGLGCTPVSDCLRKLFNNTIKTWQYVAKLCSCLHSTVNFISALSKTQEEPWLPTQTLPSLSTCLFTGESSCLFGGRLMGKAVECSKLTSPTPSLSLPPPSLDKCLC